MKKYRFCLMILVLISLLSCSKANNEIMLMNNLKNNISKIYDIQRIDIKMLNQDDIKITFTDSRFNNYSSNEKQKLAKEIGALVTKLTEDKSKIITGELIFIDESNYLLVKAKKSESFKIF